MQDSQHQSHRSFLSDTWHIAKDTYKTWFTYGWLLIGTRLVAEYFYPSLNILSTPFAVAGFWHDGIKEIALTLPWIMASLLVVLTYKTLYLSAKPTKQHKNYAYFMHYILHVGVLIGWFCVVTLLYWTRDLLKIMKAPMIMVAPIFIGGGIILGLFSLFFIAALFEHEHINIGEICKRTYGAIVKNIPLLIAISVVFAIGYAVFYTIVILLLDKIIFREWNTYHSYLLASGKAPFSDGDESLSEFISFAVREGHDSMNFARTYAHAIFDFLIALPFLVITTTSVYYRRRHE